MNESQARRLAEEYIAREIQPRAIHELVVIWVREYEACWVAHFDTREFAETGNLKSRIIGSPYLTINKRTRSIRIPALHRPGSELLDKE